MNRVYLNIPYANKALAKKEGCRWDEDSRKWFYPCENLADIPAVLREYLPDDAQVVPDPAKVRREAEAACRAQMLELLPQYFADLRHQLAECGPEGIDLSWASKEDRERIYTLVISRFDREALEMAAERIKNYLFWKDFDAQSNLAQSLRGVVVEISSEAEKQVWKEVTTPLFEHYFDCLDNWDMSLLPHGYIDHGMVFEQGDICITFGHCNLLPCIHSVVYRGELLYANEAEKSAILYNGKHVQWGLFHPKLQTFNRELAKRHVEATTRVLADVIVNDRCVRSVHGENYTLTTEDGRVITGFFADGEYYIYNWMERP